MRLNQYSSHISLFIYVHKMLGPSYSLLEQQYLTYDPESGLATVLQSQNPLF